MLGTWFGLRGASRGLFGYQVYFQYHIRRKKTAIVM